MECGARGVPAPEVRWVKDSGANFPAASERRITQNLLPLDANELTRFNSFNIWDIKAVDMGVYSCIATNPAGSISWNITLAVLETPRYCFYST